MATQNLNCHTRTKRCNGNIKWDMVMFSYSFVLMLFSHFFSLSREGQKQIFKEYCLVVVAFLIAIEILNQITFLYARIDRKTAIRIKCLAFWVIYTGSIATYVFFTSRLQKIDNWDWREGIMSLLAYVVLSWVFPTYSVCPDIRFIFLYGRFKSK